MGLYESGRKVAPADAVMGAQRFLIKAREWALGEIEKRGERIFQLEQGNEKMEEIRKLEEWKSYLKFTEHALKELERGELDEWFEGE